MKIKSRSTKVKQPITDPSGIALYFHCANCLDNRPEDKSPKEWSMTQTGISNTGELIVWCNRCEQAVIVIPADQFAEAIAMLITKVCSCCNHAEESTSH